MNRLLKLIAAAVLGICSSCRSTDAGPAAEPVNQQAPPSPKPRVLIWPEDLSSNTGGQPVVVWVGSSGPIIDRELLGQLKASISLRRLTGGANVTVTTKLSVDTPEAERRPPPYSTGGNYYQWEYIELRSADAMSAEWHSIFLPASAANVDFPGTRLENGVKALVSRFHPLSAPTIRQIQLCEPPGKARSAFVDFSEPVEPVSSDLLTLGEMGGARCTAEPATPADATRSIQFSCDGTKADADWNLEAPSTWKSASGAPLRSLNGTVGYNSTFRPSELPVGSDGCRLWRP